LACVDRAWTRREQRGNQLRLRTDQARLQHVGEEVVVAEPFPPVVQGDEEDIVALQRQERPGAVVTPTHSVTRAGA